MVSIWYSKNHTQNFKNDSTLTSGDLSMCVLSGKPRALKCTLIDLMYYKSLMSMTHNFSCVLWSTVAVHIQNEGFCKFLNKYYSLFPKKERKKDQNETNKKIPWNWIFQLEYQICVAKRILSRKRKRQFKMSHEI